MNDDVLKNLGKALYIHKALMKTAEDAKEAVDYFSNVGALDMGLIKEAGWGLPGAIAGVYRSENLTDDEKKQLKKRYGLKDDASLALRNAGRGFLGGVGGFTAGAIGGGLLNGTLDLSAKSNTLVRGKLPKVLAVLGAAGGTYLATNKYSKKNVRRKED